jgi:hypothetical protein
MAGLPYYLLSRTRSIVTIWESQVRMIRKKIANPHLNFSSDVGTSIASVAEATMQPVLCPGNDTRLYGVQIDILKGRQKLSETIQNMGKEALTPYMTPVSENTVVFPREYTHYPLHDSRKGDSFSRLDDEVEMVTHDAEILDPEIVLPLRSLYDLEEHITHVRRAEDHFSPIRPRDDMIASTFAQDSWFTHTIETQRTCSRDSTRRRKTSQHNEVSLACSRPLSPFCLKVLGLVAALGLAGAVNAAAQSGTKYNYAPDGSLTATYQISPTFSVTETISDGFKRPSPDPSGSIDSMAGSDYSAIIKIGEDAIASFESEIASIPSSSAESDYKLMKNYAGMLTRLAVAYDKTGRQESISGVVLPRVGDLAKKMFRMAKLSQDKSEKIRICGECVQILYENFTSIFGEERWLSIMGKNDKTYLDRIVASYYTLGKKTEYQRIIPTYEKVEKM